MDTIMLDSYILVEPSNKLREFIKQLKTKGNLPSRIHSILGKKGLKNIDKSATNKFATAAKDFSFLSSINNKLKNENIFNDLLSYEINTFSTKETNEGYLQIDDLLWLQREIEKRNKNGSRIYLHELLKGISIQVPENIKIERNPELEKRCIYLKTQQDNMKYKSMTKNVDNVRLQEPEETISYQLKQINKQLIAVAQFIISVIAGFAFGFIGIELLIGNLDFGFRLLLGIMCALTIALAELYFLAKQLAE